MTHRVLVVMGTRPEAIKLAPVILALQQASDLEPIVVVTGQHRAMLDEVLTVFEIRPDHDLDLIRTRQSLTHVTVAALEGVGRILAAEQPDVVVVQGDTTTTLAASLAAFYHQVPLAHVEAGLRSGSRTVPYPEELNRQLTSRLADLHLCPTSGNRDNLLAEGIRSEQILVTGNTVIDALQQVVQRPGGAPDWLAADDRRLVLVTAHRRESWAGGLHRIATGIRDAVADRQDVRVVFPIHPNPVVREAMVPVLADLPQVRIIDPLPYHAFAKVLARAHVVVTDSGGIQEEAPGLGVPVLVTRGTTERPEAVTAGAVHLVGDDPEVISRELRRLLDDDGAHSAMATVVNPYGDGRASDRVVQALRMLLSGAPAPEQYVPRS